MENKNINILAKKKVLKCIEEIGVDTRLVNESNGQANPEDDDCLIVPFKSDLVIGEWIEVQFRFKKNKPEIRAYIGQVFVQLERYDIIEDAISHTNKCLKMSSYAFSPQLVFDRNTGDIYVEYDISYEVLIKKTMDILLFWLLIEPKKLLGKACYPLVCLDMDRMAPEDAKSFIKRVILYPKLIDYLD